MQKLARTFPGARFIVIWRDLADTCRSIVRAAEGSAYFAKRGMIHRAILGNRRMKRECDALVRDGAPLHQIQYEELIDSPETVMQGVCWFLQIPFDRRMASLTGADVSAIFDAPQHAGVKTTKIGIQRAREEVLSAQQRIQIARYTALWKKQFGNAWPVYPRRCDAAPAGLIERLRDEIYYRWLRVFDRFTAFVYCHAPLGWLRRYRNRKVPLPAARPVERKAAMPPVEEVSTRS